MSSLDIRDKNQINKDRGNSELVTQDGSPPLVHPKSLNNPSSFIKKLFSEYIADRNRRSRLGDA